jgi:hypothetical protein
MPVLFIHIIVTLAKYTRLKKPFLLKIVDNYCFTGYHLAMTQPDAPELLPDLFDRSAAFGEVADLAFRMGEDPQENTLGIKPSVITDTYGRRLGYLVTARSILTAFGKLGRPEIFVDDGQVVHQTAHPEMAAEAMLVALWPDANEGDGDASLHRIETTFTPPPDRRKGPLLDIVKKLHFPEGEVLSEDEEDHYGPGTVLADAKKIYIIGSEGTQIETAVEGHQQLTREVGLKGLIHGPATAVLGHGPETIARVADGRLYWLGGVNHRLLPITVPEDPTENYAGRIALKSDGRFVLTGKGAVAANKTLHGPQLSPAEVLALADSPLQWDDATDRFLVHWQTKENVAKLLPLGWERQRLAELYAFAQQKLEAGHAAARLALTGSQVVAAQLKSMPRRDRYDDVDIRYYK